MVLTHAGDTLLRDAKAIFGMVDQAGRGKLGRLDVGVYGSAIFGIVPNILARFSRKNPDVEIALYHAQTPQQVSALRQGRVSRAANKLFWRRCCVLLYRCVHARSRVCLEA